MSSLRDARRLLAFDDWANTRVLQTLDPIEAKVPKAVAWMAHVMAAKRIWHARVTGSTPPFSVRPDLAAAAIRAELRQAHDEWAGHLDQLTDVDLDGVIHYANLKGEPFQSTLAEILTHVAIHGQHHRGQCLAAIREAGFAPPAIDYIHATRTGAV